MDDKKILFVTTLIASMLHMANIDGEYALEEKRYINKIRSQFNVIFDEIDVVVKEIERCDDKEEYILNMLEECCQTLSSKELFDLLAHSAKVLVIDGKIQEKEEYLMKSYLLACNFPTKLYPELLKRAKA